MELIVDGELNPVSVPEGATVADVLHLADEQLSQASRMIVSIRIDGEQLPADRLSEYQPRDVSSVERIEIGSQPVQEITQGAIGQLETSLPDLSRTITELSATFQQGDTEHAIKVLPRVLDVWLAAVETERTLGSILGADFSSIEVNGQPVNSLHEALNEELGKATSALESEDYVLLADLLEHELAPRIRTELKIVACLKDLAQRTLS